MSAEFDDDPTAGGFNGLKRLERTLPSSWYFDPAHYARELEGIWYRNWVYLCRAATLPEARSYRTFTLGTQPLVVVRDEQGELRAFFNTCRHRGAMLCQEPEGRLPANAITCPYHAWSYRLSGELARIPSMGRPHYLPQGEVSLYAVPIRLWRGFVYVNLGDPARGLADNFNANTDEFAHWPLEDLAIGHRFSRRLRCNWKVFWENYNECLHCPTVHPSLSSLVPIYKRGIMEERDDPDWQAHAGSDDPQYKGGLRKGAVTWSVDGRAVGHEFEGLSTAERRAGYHFMTSLPSHYLVLHVDHVRSTRLWPLGPEETELSTEWLFPRETLADPAADLARSCDFSAQVLAEDGDICELAQRGLRSAKHERGFLMPEEYDVYRFQQWVRSALERA
jgi:glycine betaine catabolism A